MARKHKKVMIFGTFDILHAGHFGLFEEAKKHGNFLCAVVARDTNVEKIKKIKSFHDENQRKFFLEHIDFIDKAILGDKRDVYKAIKKEKPDVIVLGYDQVNFVDKLKTILKEHSLKTKVVRAKAYRSNSFKTSKIKEYLNKMI